MLSASQWRQSTVLALCLRKFKGNGMALFSYFEGWPA